MSTSNTYAPYIQLSYQILATLEDFKGVQEKRDKSIDDLKNFKSLLISNQEVLSHFPIIRQEFYSFLSYAKVDKSNQSNLIAICDKLNLIHSYIKTGEEHILYIQEKCFVDNETIIAQAKDLFHSAYNELSIREIQTISKKIKEQVNKLETIIVNYEIEQEEIRKEKERLRQEEEERLRREEEERQRLAEEERLRKEKQRKLIINILKWVGIATAIILVGGALIYYIIIPVILWIIEYIWWIVAGIVVLGIIIIKSSS